MPFRSKAQMKACYAQKRRNPNSKWDCRKWAKETSNLKSLPEHKPKRRKLKGR